MRRTALHALLIVALMIQGVVSIGADFSASNHEAQQHCAGHDMSSQDCACCPEGMADTNCTVQCSVLQVPEMVEAPARFELRSHYVKAPEASVRSRFYTPIDPPPIA
jgi:hypothetical protein